MADFAFSLPRILCFHGGDMLARVVKLQCRAIELVLKIHSRLVFVKPPFEAQPARKSEQYIIHMRRSKASYAYSETLCEREIMGT